MINEPSSENRPTHPVEQPPEPAPVTGEYDPVLPADGRKLHPLERRAQEMRARQREGIAQPEAMARPRRGRRVSQRIPLSDAPLTYALVAINILIFAVGLFASQLGDQFFEFGAKYTPFIVLKGEYYRLFSAMFLHADPAHIFFNSYALYVIGAPLETRFGRSRFGIIYLLGGLMGSVLSLVLGELLVPSIGASGAVFALLGAEMVFLYRNRQAFGGQGRARLNQLFFLLAINLFIGIASTRIDNWGHIGGFIGGAALAWFIGPLYQPAPHPERPGVMIAEDTNPLARNFGAVLAYGVALVAILILSIPALERSLT